MVDEDVSKVPVMVHEQPEEVEGVANREKKCYGKVVDNQVIRRLDV